MRLIALVVLPIGLLVACGGHNNQTVDGPAGGGSDSGLAIDSASTTDSSGANPSTVTLTLNNRPNNASTFTFIVAYQDGGGAWTLAPSPVGDTYSFMINAPIYGVMWSCIATIPNPNGGALSLRSVTSAYFAKTERTALVMDVPPRCTDRITAVSLSGNVSNTGGGFLNVQFGERSTFVNGATGNYAMETPPSTHDLDVTHLAPTGVGTDFAVDEAVVQRSVLVTAATTKNVDFSTRAATQSFVVTAVGPLNARISTTTLLYTAHGTTTLLVSEANAPYETVSLNATQMLAGDVYDQTITVASAGQAATVTNATDTPGPLTYTAPPPLGAVTSTVPTKIPYPQLATTWTEYANATGYTWLGSQQLNGGACGGGACQVTWTTFLSPGVAGTAPIYQMPDLSALTGWSTRFQYVSGTIVGGAVQAMVSSAGAQDFPPGKPVVGTQRELVRSDWAVTP